MRRFWDKVDVGTEDECWNWTANKAHGYGRFLLDRKWRQAHRVAWRLSGGIIPDGMWILHSCDNPSCVNPRHLFLGTRQDNMDDMKSKGRTKGNAMKGEKNPSSKLKEGEVLAIRALGSKGKWTKQEIATAYKISHQTVSDIILRRKWRHC